MAVFNQQETETAVSDAGRQQEVVTLGENRIFSTRDQKYQHG
jgi:hypothetical protein